MSIWHVIRKAGVGAEQGVEKALDALGKPIGAVAAPVLEHAAVTLLTGGVSKAALELAGKRIAKTLTSNLKDYAERHASRPPADAAQAWRAMEWRIAAEVADTVMKTLND